MPSKTRKDGDSGKDKEKDRTHRRKSERTPRKSSVSPARGTPSSTSSSTRRKKVSTLEGAGSRATPAKDTPASSKTSLPYPSFSKAHSKESVSRDLHVDVFTPQPTDLAAEHKDSPRSSSPPRNKDSTAKVNTGPAAVPPSPPLTSASEATRNRSPAKSRRKESKSELKNKRSKGEVVTKSAVNRKEKQEKSGEDAQAAQPTKPRVAPRQATVQTEVGSTVDSEGTTITEVLPRHNPASVLSSINPASTSEAPPARSVTPRAAVDVGRQPVDIDNRISGLSQEPSWAAQQSPQPPPPPPPPSVPVNIPRVDYLLVNGGLTHNVPRRLVEAYTGSTPGQTAPSYPHLSAQAESVLSSIFTPFHQLLREYETVLSKNGSVAVATGYRSIARRLLDRLEAVFARDISSELCTCSQCRQLNASEESPYGLGWGDILEWVSGRKEVPPWPPFDFDALGRLRDDLKIDTAAGGKSRIVRPASVDPDLPSEFRDHYRRQTKKKKEEVDRWLAAQFTNPTAPPQGVDDETLTFAIATHFKPAERDFFNELLTTSTTDLKASPVDDNLLGRTATALQRLYRLAVPPRPPECAAFLVKYPLMHHILAALAAVNTSEWDILTSGRFDGFLWSGADDVNNMTSPPRSSASTPWSRGASPARMGSRGEAGKPNTPFQSMAAAVSRGVTPAPGPPVSHDEETEIAVLAEVEREIYLGMEALEDAFEALHKRAEGVRLALRERGAGLSMAGQSRRQFWPGEGSVPPEYGRGTPGCGYPPEWESEDDTPWGSRDIDAVSDVWSDDSASNVSTSRVRRPKRRTERRTPAPVEECDEGNEV
ncbi:MAG: hypothetical protein M1823_004058 [Watsoniomyces obsoletus]|nr:MAG: hypothetical protein M1823_004058 [Watsoniomyces obsoletus]